MKDTLFISEKTYKAIAFKQLLVFGIETLAHLHKTGYKTFRPNINEDYDSEHDDQKRYDMLVAEVKRLCSMNDSEWIEWQHNVKEIVEHNYTILQNKQTFHDIKNIDNFFRYILLLNKRTGAKFVLRISKIS